jgi:hypothetical protein
MTAPTQPQPKKHSALAWIIGVLLVGGCISGLASPNKNLGPSGKPKLGTQECQDAMLARGRKYKGDYSDYTPSERRDAWADMDDACDETSVVTTTKYTPYTTTYTYR